MNNNIRHHFIAIGITAVLLLAGNYRPLFAQANGGNQGGNNQGGNNQGGNGAGGILIDANGVVTPVFSRGGSARLVKKRLAEAAGKSLSDDVNRPSELRKVSLVRLEAEYEAYALRNEPVPPDMQFLAGLLRIDYVFVYPETNDLVIAGPAEGFAADAVGRVVGVETGRPPLRLDDLIIALRALQRRGIVGCSIDPVPEKLSALQDYLRRNSNAVSTSVAKRRFHQMAKIVGLQDVRVMGVPADSHFAQVLVESDFRMKQISLGLENPGVRGLPSHLSMVGREGNSMQRWWFMPMYDAFQTSVDGNAFQLAGQRAQLMSQEESSDAAGNRSDAAFTRISTQRFAKIFTQKFPDLANASPVFAELQNLIDLLVVAALFKKEQLPQRIGWEQALFLDEDRAQYERGNVPRQVPTLVNYRQARKSMLVGLVGGGVTIDPMRTLNAIEFQIDPAIRLDGVRTSATSPPVAEKHPWWWD